MGFGGAGFLGINIHHQKNIYIYIYRCKDVYIYNKYISIYNEKKHVYIANRHIYIIIPFCCAYRSKNVSRLVYTYIYIVGFDQYIFIFTHP